MLIQPIIGAVLWSATCVTDGARGKVLKNWLGLSYLWRCRTPGEMRRTMDIIRRLTARSARPGVGCDLQHGRRRHEDDEGLHGKLIIQSTRISQTLDGQPRSPLCRDFSAWHPAELTVGRVFLFCWQSVGTTQRV